MENFRSFIQWVRSQTRPVKIAVVAIIAAIVAVLSFSSCARSRVLFKGQGDLEYEYVGEHAPRNFER